MISVSAFASLQLLLLCCVQHPVYCVNVVGTQNANNLISISTDGKMCSWSLDMLSQPQVHYTRMDHEQTHYHYIQGCDADPWTAACGFLAGQSGAGV